MKNIAIITARGGSKRIPRKNIRSFCGKPILAYSIEAAIKSKIFDEVMVSTDDNEIKEIALHYGATVPFMRSSNTASDTATTYDVLNEVITKYDKIGRQFDNLCCIYPTAPFVTADKLIKALEILNEKEYDGVIPVVPFSFPPQRGLLIDNDKVSFANPQYALTRSQDLQKMYHDCGQFYFVKTNPFLQQKKLLLDNMYGMIMDELEVQDIDNETDWKIAELKYQLYRKIDTY